MRAVEGLLTLPVQPPELRSIGLETGAPRHDPSVRPVGAPKAVPNAEARFEQRGLRANGGEHRGRATPASAATPSMDVARYPFVRNSEAAAVRIARERLRFGSWIDRSAGG